MRFFPFVTRDERRVPSLDIQMIEILCEVVEQENRWKWLDYLETHTS